MDPSAGQQPALDMMLLDLPVLVGTAEFCLAQGAPAFFLPWPFSSMWFSVPIYTWIPGSLTLLSFGLSRQTGPAAKNIPPINTAKLSVSAPFLRDYLHSYLAAICGARPRLTQSCNPVSRGIATSGQTWKLCLFNQHLSIAQTGTGSNVY